MCLSDEWKTTLKTRDGLFEWMVMPFSPSNAPSIFMGFMNDILKPCIGICVVVYLMTYLLIAEMREHVEHLTWIFTIFREHKLYVNLKKCGFFTNIIVFLGYIVTKYGIEIDLSKIKSILDWPVPSLIHDIQSFHGLVSFYIRFV